MAENVLHQMIEERSARIEELRAQMTALDAEIRVLKEAVTRSSSASPRDDDSPKLTDKTKKTRPLKDKWADIMRFVGHQGEASLDDVMSYGDRNGYDLNRNTARSQFHLYRKEGWFESVRKGVVRLTQDGADRCGYVESNEVSSSEQNDEGDAQKDDEPQPVRANGSVGNGHGDSHGTFSFGSNSR